MPNKTPSPLVRAMRREQQIANPRGQTRQKQRDLIADAQRDLFARTALVAAGFKRADLSKAMMRVREGLDATTVKVAYDSRIVNPDRTTGGFVESKPYVDHRTRMAASDLVMQMVPGMKAPKDERQTGDIVVEILTVAPDGTKTAVRLNA